MFQTKGAWHEELGIFAAFPEKARFAASCFYFPSCNPACGLLRFLPRLGDCRRDQVVRPSRRLGQRLLLRKRFSSLRSRRGLLLRFSERLLFGLRMPVRLWHPLRPSLELVQLRPLHNLLDRFNNFHNDNYNPRLHLQLLRRLHNQAERRGLHDN